MQTSNTQSTYVVAYTPASQESSKENLAKTKEFRSSIRALGCMPDIIVKKFDSALRNRIVETIRLTKCLPYLCNLVLQVVLCNLCYLIPLKYMYQCNC